MEINLLAYTAIDGIPTMTDSEVMGLYDQVVDDGTSDTVFYDGSVKNADEFLSVMKHGPNQLFMVSIDGNVSGIMWLNDFEMKRASIHFCFFSNAWGKNMIEVGKECFSYLLNMKRNEEYMFDAFTGFVPEFNKLAHKWLVGIGISVLGTMPSACWVHKFNKSVPGTFYYVERCNYG